MVLTFVLINLKHCFYGREVEDLVSTLMYPASVYVFADMTQVNRIL